MVNNLVYSVKARYLFGDLQSVSLEKDVVYRSSRLLTAVISRQQALRRRSVESRA